MTTQASRSLDSQPGGCDQEKQGQYSYMPYTSSRCFPPDPNAGQNAMLISVHAGRIDSYDCVRFSQDAYDGDEYFQQPSRWSQSSYAGQGQEMGHVSCNFGISHNLQCLAA